MILRERLDESLRMLVSMHPKNDIIYSSKFKLHSELTTHIPQERVPEDKKHSQLQLRRGLLFDAVAFLLICCCPVV